MKIAFLHMTLGLVDRGSEVVTDLAASSLASKHQVLVLQSGPLSKKAYQVKRVYLLTSAPAVAPTNIFEKLLFRTHLNLAARLIKAFTLASLPLISKFQPDIIVAVNGSSQLRILQSQSLKAKLVVFGHAGIGHDDLANLKNSPDLFVALSRHAESWAREHALSPTKVVYIPNPLPPSKIKPIDLNLPRPIVLTVGALSRYKNIDSVIKAVSRLQASYLLIGDGEEGSTIADALNNFPGDFRWIKHVDPSEIPSYYAASDIFCFVPDPQEAFGRVYLEAMNAGLPIVASDDPIRRGIIGEQGNYAPPHDINSIVSALQSASTQGKIDYKAELKPYQLKTVITQIEKEFHALI